MWLHILIGGILGLVLLFYDVIGSLRDNKRVPSPTDLDIQELSCLEWGVIFHENKKKLKIALVAEIIHLAQQKKIKIKGDLKSTLSSYRKAKIHIEKLNINGLSQLQKKIVKKVAENQELKEVMKGDEFLEEVTAETKEELKGKKLLSAANMQIKKRIALSSLIFFFPGLGFFFWGLLNSGGVFAGIGIAGFLLGVSRLIKVFTIPVLSEEGLYVKNEIRTRLEKTYAELEDDLTRDSARGIKDFFSKLPRLILHPDFGRRRLRQYKKLLNEKDNIELPDWVELKADGEEVAQATPEEVFNGLLKGIIFS